MLLFFLPFLMVCGRRSAVSIVRVGRMDGRSERGQCGREERWREGGRGRVAGELDVRAFGGHR